MIETRLLGWILLALRLVAVSYMIAVIYRQLMLMRSTVTEYGTVRVVLLTIVGLTFIGNFIPIAIDLYAINTGAGRSPSPILTAYAVSNALVAVFSAIGWWVLYRVVDIDRAKLQKDRDVAEAENVELTRELKEEREGNGVHD